MNLVTPKYKGVEANNFFDSTVGLLQPADDDSGLVGQHVAHRLPEPRQVPRHTHGLRKGVVEAIEIGRRCGLPVKIAGIIQDEVYFRDHVEPMLRPGVADFLGPADHGAKNKLLGEARALIHFINFNEPFGFTMIEAMACGTPVIARGLGSVPEVVDDEVSGFVVSTLEDAVEAVSRLPRIDRRRVREVAEERWTSRRMVRDYIRVYQRILQGIQ